MCVVGYLIIGIFVVRWKFEGDWYFFFIVLLIIVVILNIEKENIIIVIFMLDFNKIWNLEMS